ncbi:type II toxin-antitoxin system RelE/ParE family toxin [Methylobacterium sp. SI9]|uniref:type II toxin-antitoxin system RelE/ParE family toxin n=1 Tax=Methylobacterium guangdongense TaxID=3138811 RepID=UPI00313C0155
MRIRLSAAARRVLSEIWSFTARHWDRNQADRYLRLLAGSFDGLAHGTVRERACEEIHAGYFELSVGAHRIFYRLDPSNEIQIVRILHRSMDVERHL